jgi:hypothetical protein
MNNSKYGNTGRAPVLRHIDAEVLVIAAAEVAISKANERILALEVLLRFCECPKCGAELEGGVMAADELADAVKLVGRQDVPCAFCDTPEQKAAMEKALEMVGG